MNNTKNYLFLKTLDDLDFIPIESMTEVILYDSIKKSLEDVGVAYSKAVIDHICKFTGLSEREILTNCDLFEDSMYRLFGHGATSIINKVKALTLRTAVLENKSELTVPQILDPSLTLNDILMEIRRIEALNFISKMSSYSHIAFLYSREDSLRKILVEYFRPTETLRALLSENPKKYNHLELSTSSSYKELFENVPDTSKESTINSFLNWLRQAGETISKTESRKPLRFAEDDATWWIRNGRVRTLIAIEQLVQKEMLGSASILSAFDVSKLSIKELGTLKSVIRYHDYVIIEEPTFAIYKLNRPNFRHE